MSESAITDNGQCAGEAAVCPAAGGAACGVSTARFPLCLEFKVTPGCCGEGDDGGCGDPGPGGACGCEYEQLLEENGWAQLPGGLILQWGWNDHQANPANAKGEARVVFPRPFPSRCLHVNVCDLSHKDSGLTGVLTFGVESTTMNNESFILRCAAENSAAYWLAIGF